MATAVRQIEITDIPSFVNDLDGYDHLFVLFRYKGKPVGSRVFPVQNGRFEPAKTDDLLTDAIRNQLIDHALNHYLNTGKDFTPEPVLLKATVAICTRNRTEDLHRCLNALMHLPDDGQEILVIDNYPSTDDTKELVQQFSKVKYIREDRPGLNIARNRAIAEAQNEIVAFTDDDAVPDENWLRALLKNFDHPLVLCLTGMTMPLELETEAQVLFEKYSPFGKGFSRRRWNAEKNNPLATGQVGAGANMALRKDAVNLVGWFDEALDAGTDTHSGGDHEMFARILSRGYEIIYEPEALSWHRHRRSRQELKQAIYGYGVGVYAFWTRILVQEKEWSILKLPLLWFIKTQLPQLAKSLLKQPGSMPTELLMAELRGCMAGPFAYWSAKKKVQKHEQP